MDGMKVSKSHKAYGRPENPANLIACLIASVLSFVGVVFLLLHSSTGGVTAIVSASILGALLVTAFIIGTVASLTPVGGRYSLNATRLDRATVSILVTAASAPIFLYGFTQGGITSSVWGYTLFAIAACATTAAVIINLIDPKNAKIFSLVLYVIVAWTLAIRADLIVSQCGGAFSWMLLAATALYIVGIAIGGWQAMPARQTVRYVCVICGTALVYAGVYVFLF